MDFKSGKHPDWRPYSTAARLGWNIQATLYPWLHGGKGAEFRYLYLGDEEAQAGESAGAPTAEGLLAELAPFLEKGFYPPTSLQTVAALGRLPEKDVPGCAFCELASVCRRFETGHAARHAKLLEEHAPKRSATIRGMGAVSAKGRKR